MARRSWKTIAAKELMQMSSIGPGCAQSASKAKSVDPSISRNVQPVLGRNQGLEVT